MSFFRPSSPGSHASTCSSRSCRVLAVMVGILAACAAPRAHAVSTTLSVSVYVNSTTTTYNLTFAAQQAAFGMAIGTGEVVAGYLVLGTPFDGCSSEVAPTVTVATTGGAAAGGAGVNGTALVPWFALLTRNISSCDFETKVHNAQINGAEYALVANSPGTTDTLITMGASQSNAVIVTIGAAFIEYQTLQKLLPIMEANGGYVYVRIFNTDTGPSAWSAILFVSMLAFLVSSFFILLFLTLDYFRHRRRRGMLRAPLEPIPENVLKAIPEVEVTAEDVADVDRNLTCAICLDDFVVGDRLKRLPCRHEFHLACIGPWFDRRQRLCPTCKQDILVSPNGTPWVAMNEAVAIEMQNLAEGVLPSDPPYTSMSNLASAAEAGGAGVSSSTLVLSVAVPEAAPARQATPVSLQQSASGDLETVPI